MTAQIILPATPGLPVALEANGYTVTVGIQPPIDRDVRVLLAVAGPTSEIKEQLVWTLPAPGRTEALVKEIEQRLWALLHLAGIEPARLWGARLAIAVAQGGRPRQAAARLLNALATTAIATATLEHPHPPLRICEAAADTIADTGSATAHCEVRRG